MESSSVRETAREACAPEGQASPGLEGDRTRANTDVEALYRNHFKFVWRTLRRLGVRFEQLDDAAQEVFLVVHRRQDSFASGGAERGWLFAIAQRVASDQRRTLRRKGGLVQLPNDLLAREPDPYEQTMRKEAHDVVLSFLEGLPDELRAVFIMAELEHMSAKEIAEVSQVNPNTVYTRIATARRRFAEFAASLPSREP